VPNWQPNWQDVRWDFAAADRAASELDRAADDVDRTSAARDQAAQRAMAGWRGAYRLQFDAQLQGTQRTARYLAGTFRAAAVRVRQASGQAMQEQVSRERARERWRREKADEDAARAANRVRCQTIHDPA
jgi:hypothetical protein